MHAQFLKRAGNLNYIAKTLNSDNTCPLWFIRK